MEDKKTDFLTWIKTNKKKLIIAGISVTAIIAVILGIKNKDALMEIWDSLKESIAKSPINISEKRVSVAEVVPDAILVVDSAATRSYTSHTSLFDVTGHIRTLSEGRHHSKAKAVEAATAGMDLQANQTWVNPYTKGGAAA